VESSFSRHPLRGTHAPQSIIYGTPRGEKHPKGDSTGLVGHEHYERAMTEWEKP